MKTVYLLVNGILTFPGAAKNWNGRGVTWVHTNTEGRAEKIEYFCTAIGRAFGQRNRATKLFRTASFYSIGWNCVAVGHSNGAAVILSALRDYPNGWPNISHLHLFCAACDADFEKNALNDLIARRRIQRVTVYVAGQDMALGLAHHWPGKLLGYGTLGLHGPRNVRTGLSQYVAVIRGGNWRHYGHSDCWHDDHFEQTMSMIEA